MEAVLPCGSWNRLQPPGDPELWMEVEVVGAGLELFLPGMIERYGGDGSRLTLTA